MYPELNFIIQKFNVQPIWIYLYVVITSIPIKSPYEETVPGIVYTDADRSVSKITGCDQGAVMQQ